MKEISQLYIYLLVRYKKCGGWDTKPWRSNQRVKFKPLRLVQISLMKNFYHLHVMIKVYIYNFFL